MILITVLVARTLSQNGGAFLADGFGGNEALDQALVFLSSKLGFVLLILGVAHFFNLSFISRFKTTQQNRMELRQRVDSHCAVQEATDV